MTKSNLWWYVSGFSTGLGMMLVGLGSHYGMLLLLGATICAMIAVREEGNKR